MPPKKKISSSLTEEKRPETSSEEEAPPVKKSKEKTAPVPPKKAPSLRRIVALKYLSAQEFLLRKGVKATHISVYVAKAMSLGYTRATASEWDSLLFGKS